MMNKKLLSQIEVFAATLPDTQRKALNLLLFLGLPPLDQLAIMPPETLLDAAEIKALEAAQATAPENGTVGTHSLVIIIKATRRCNLRCLYCRAWRDNSHPDMSFETLTHVMAQVLAATDLRNVEFVWHGGEVTLLESAFFLKALYLQSRLNARGIAISNSVQTNGVRINSDMMELFRYYGFSVGVSIDAPRDVHDRLRLNAAGKPTWLQVKAGIIKMQELELPLALLCVVGPETVRLGARALLDSLCDLSVSNVGLLNMVPENGQECQSALGSYLPWSDYIVFLQEVYSLWRSEYYELLDIRELRDLERLVEGSQATMCYFAGNCMGRFLTIEHDGAIAACDKYVGEAEYGFGELPGQSLSEILAESSNLARSRDEIDCDKAKMSKCKWYGACRGGCPHDRRMTQRLDEAASGCCGYAPLLDHIAENTPAH